jgi:hypothetical protein
MKFKTLLSKLYASDCIWIDKLDVMAGFAGNNTKALGGKFGKVVGIEVLQEDAIVTIKCTEEEADFLKENL